MNNQIEPLFCHGLEMVSVFMSSFCRTREESRLSNRFTPWCFSRKEPHNRVPAVLRELVTGELPPLVCRCCLAPCEEVRSIETLVRPSVIMPLSIEPSKPHLIYDASSLDARCRHIGLSLDSVRSVAVLGWEGCYQGSLDDKSGFHKVTSHPMSRPVFGWQLGRVLRTSGRFVN